MTDVCGHITELTPKEILNLTDATKYRNVIKLVEDLPQEDPENYHVHEYLSWAYFHAGDFKNHSSMQRR